MVQQSMNVQERLVEQDMRNHSELMFVTDRNHLEMIGIINSTLQTLSNVAHEYVSKM